MLLLYINFIEQLIIILYIFIGVKDSSNKLVPKVTITGNTSEVFCVRFR